VTGLATEAVAVIARLRAQGLRWCSTCAAWKEPTHFDVLARAAWLADQAAEPEADPQP
jgi:hypothetical protein